MKKCLNIIVYFNNFEEIVLYLQKTLVNSPECVDFLLVVNSDSSDKAKMISDIFPNNKIRIANYGKNVGYLNSLLLSIQDLNIDIYEYIILSNTDIEYVTDDFYRKLLDKNYSDDIGCIAPDVYSTLTKTHSNPHYINRLSKNRIKRVIFVFRHPILVPLYIRLANIKAKIVKKEMRQACYVYSPHGCFMILKQPFIEKIRGILYDSFMYTEEGFIGENLLGNSLKCYYDDSLKVIHKEHSTTNNLKIEQQAKYFRESLENFLKEFYE